MKPTLDGIQARVQPDGTFLAPCPACGEIQPVEVGPRDRENRSLVVTCSCGHRYPVYLEYRRAYRRHVDRTGTYRSGNGPDREGIAFISNLSMTGVGFRTAGNHGFTTGDVLEICFALDDTEETIQASAVVKHTRATYLGVQFTQLSHRDEERLATFLAGIS